jgi:CheY-like chemotaxis protein
MGKEQKTVLVVDDDPAVQRFVRLVLQTAGYRVEVAGDGAEALAKLPEVQPHLMVLDLLMPVLDGWGVLQQLRGQTSPLILVLSEIADPRRALREGAAACLGKPITAAVLIEACGRLLGPP